MARGEDGTGRRQQRLRLSRRQFWQWQSRHEPLLTRLPEPTQTRASIIAAIAKTLADSRGLRLGKGANVPFLGGDLWDNGDCSLIMAASAQG